MANRLGPVPDGYLTATDARTRYFPQMNASGFKALVVFGILTPHREGQRVLYSIEELKQAQDIYLTASDIVSNRTPVQARNRS